MMSKRTKRFRNLAIIAGAAAAYSLIKDYTDYVDELETIITKQDQAIGEFEQFIIDNVVGCEFPDIF